MPSKKQVYIDNKKFLELLIEFQDLNEDLTNWTSKSNPETESQLRMKTYRKDLLKKRKEKLKNETEEERNIRRKRLEEVLNILGKAFLLITDGMLKKPNFINYDYYRKQEMTSDATFFMLNYIDRYDITRSNPFAYFSQICFNAFLQNINKTNKRIETFTSLLYIENLDMVDNLIIEDYDD